MNNKQHTPGPWYVGAEFADQGRHIYAEKMVCDDEGYEWHPLIATTDDDERLVNWQANAVLIATAPDLLEALKAARQWHNGDKWRDGCTADQRAAWEAHRDMMDAVIAKATGEKA